VCRHCGSPAFRKPSANVAKSSGRRIGSQFARLEIAGSDRAPLDELVGRFLSATHDPRTVVPDAHARYYGIELNDRSLTPGDDPRLGAIRFADWLSRAVPRK
jgi:uncharacterized protein YbjT (DUF2867 family)